MRDHQFKNGVDNNYSNISVHSRIRDMNDAPKEYFFSIGHSFGPLPLGGNVEPINFSCEYKKEPPELEDNRDHSGLPIRIFVGTWNCVYQEFPEHSLVSSCEMARKSRRRERMSNWLNNLFERHDCEKYEESSSINSEELTMRQSTLQLRPLSSNDKEPLQDWISPGYDIYIITLQETLSSKLFVAISKYLSSISNDAYTRVKLEEYKLSGYGDGAFLHTKSTSLAVWVRSDLLFNEKVAIGKSKAIALSMFNHSKGVITLQMRILDQLVCIIGGHLPSKFADRERAASFLLKRIADFYGGSSGVSFQEVFHHLVWTGDFNFRVLDISADDAVALLNDHKRDVLFYHDELFSGQASIFNHYHFEEGTVKFDPTYKKRDDRDVVDKTTSNWAESEYHTHFETQWYKGKNTRERVPSWTDRVLKWSVPSLKACLEIDNSSYKAALPKTRNILLASDHSPVCCGLSLWPIRKYYMAPRRVNIDRFE